MTTSIEKQYKRYVIASIDAAGKTVYLRSMHNHQWAIVADIEAASKTCSREIAEVVLDGYMQDIGGEYEFVTIPVIMTWELVNES